jgi:hypothetical protein
MTLAMTKSHYPWIKLEDIEEGLTADFPKEDVSAFMTEVEPAVRALADCCILPGDVEQNKLLTVTSKVLWKLSETFVCMFSVNLFYCTNLVFHKNSFMCKLAFFVCSWRPLVFLGHRSAIGDEELTPSILHNTKIIVERKRKTECAWTHPVGVG